jgi:hypothetical protein
LLSNEANINETQVSTEAKTKFVNFTLYPSKIFNSNLFISSIDSNNENAAATNLTKL